MEEKARGARTAAFNVLNRVEGGDAYADILVMKETEGMPALDAALATEIAYGVLRWKIRLDYTIDLFASIKAKKLEHRVLNALRIGTYQLPFPGRGPAVGSHKRVSETLEKRRAQEIRFRQRDSPENRFREKRYRFAGFRQPCKKHIH